MADSLSTNASSDSHTVELPQAPSTREGTKGRPFGEYLVEREVARGGMGIVYRARRNADGSVVALKIIKQGPQASPRQVRRFQRETEAALLLDHPGIVRIYATGCCEGYHFYTMELVEGESLYALLKRKQRLEVKQALELVAQAAEAAHYAHEQGVVHRDLKPANILLTPDGRPKLTDFGLAKQVKAKSHLRRTDHVVGTPYYMPPEQARGDMDLDRRADVYALGVILFELLALRVPFEGTTSMEVYQHVLNSNPPSLKELDPRVDDRLERIVYQTLAKGLGDRYPTALAFAEDLRRYARGESIVAKAPAWERKRAQRLRRRIALWGGLVVIAAVAAVAVVRSRPTELTDAPPAPEHTAALAQESARREAFQAAEAALEGLFASSTQECLAADRARLAEVAEAVALLSEGGDGWRERGEALEAQRRHAAGRLELAQAQLLGPGGDWKAAAAALAGAETPELQALRARALIGADDLAQARGVLEEALAGDPYASEAALARIELDLWEGERARAQAALKAILTQDPDNVGALELATRLALGSGTLREALAHADAWGRCAPSDPGVPWLRALIAWQAGDGAALRAAQQRLGDGHPARTAAAKGMLALTRDDLPRAREAFAQALAQDPGLASATLGVALTQVQAGDVEGALETLAGLGRRTDPRARWLRSRAAATSARLHLPAAWLERARGGDAPSLEVAAQALARARELQPVAAEAFRGELERAWLEGGERLAAVLREARAYLGAEAVDAWSETQPDAEPGLGWLACWDGETQRLAGKARAAKRAFAQVRSGPEGPWAAAGREALEEAPVELAGAASSELQPPAWLAPLQVRTPAIFPRDRLGKLARDGAWGDVLIALEALVRAPAPRAAAHRWRGLVLLGARPPGLEDAPEVPAELQDPARGADVLEAALEAASVSWADFGRALIARARGDAAQALTLAERDAEARPTAAGWRLVAELKRAAGDERGAEAAAQRAQGLASQRR